MKYARLVSIFVLTIVLTTWSIVLAKVLPDKFATSAEAFPDAAAIETRDLPPGSFITRTFEAPYADIFQITIQSASPAGVVIESSDRAKGLILASKSASVRNPFTAEANVNYPAQRTYFFSIAIKEEGPTRTEITIIAKVQTSCQYNWLTGKGTCTKEATVSYAHDRWHSAKIEMNNLIGFINNNLMAKAESVAREAQAGNVGAIKRKLSSSDRVFSQPGIPDLRNQTTFHVEPVFMPLPSGVKLMFVAKPRDQLVAATKSDVGIPGIFDGDSNKEYLARVYEIVKDGTIVFVISADGLRDARLSSENEDEWGKEFWAAFDNLHENAMGGSSLQRLRIITKGIGNDENLVSGLNRIYEKEESERIPKAIASGKMTDQDVFAIAKNDRSKQLRLIAAKHLSDQKLLLQIVNESNDTDVALAALANIREEEALKDIALGNARGEIRLNATNRVADPQYLVEIALRSIQSDVAIEACSKMERQEDLIKIAQSSTLPEVRAAAVARITDNIRLLSFATKDSEWQVRKSAVSKLNNNSDLLKIISTDSNAEVKKAAAGALAYSPKLSEAVLWLRAQALADHGGMQDYLKAKPKGMHAAEAEDWINYPDVLQGELSIDFFVPVFSGSGQSSNAGMSIHSNGRSYKIILLETTKVPSTWNMFSGAALIDPGKYFLRGSISGNNVTAREIMKLIPKDMKSEVNTDSNAMPKKELEGEHKAGSLKEGGQSKLNTAESKGKRSGSDRQGQMMDLIAIAQATVEGNGKAMDVQAQGFSCPGHIGFTVVMVRETVSGSEPKSYAYLSQGTGQLIRLSPVPGASGKKYAGGITAVSLPNGFKSAPAEAKAILIKSGKPIEPECIGVYIAYSDANKLIERITDLVMNPPAAKTGGGPKTGSAKKVPPK
jgi:hypothetical protein